MTEDTVPPRDTDAKRSWRSWFRGFGRYIAWFVIAESVWAYFWTMNVQTVTSTDLPGTTSLRGLLAQRVILGALSGVWFAVVFTLLQNGLNNARRWWVTVVLVIVAVAAVNLCVSLATGTFPGQAS